MLLLQHCKFKNYLAIEHSFVSFFAWMKFFLIYFFACDLLCHASHNACIKPFLNGTGPQRLILWFTSIKLRFFFWLHKFFTTYFLYFKSTTIFSEKLCISKNSYSKRFFSYWIYKRTRYMRIIQFNKTHTFIKKRNIFY